MATPPDPSALNPVKAGKPVKPVKPVNPVNPVNPVKLSPLPNFNFMSRCCNCRCTSG